MVQKVAIYCRVSTNDQSCQRQERDLRSYARKAGWKVVGVGKETASGAKDNRKERQRLMAMAQAREIDNNLVAELTRWGRSTISRIVAAQDRGKKIGRQSGQRVKANRLATKVIKLVEEGQPYRQIAARLKMSKTIVVEIVKRHRCK